MMAETARYIGASGADGIKFHLLHVLQGTDLAGTARALVGQCEQWAKSKGCREFASDCELTNQASLAFHLSLGFTEENRIICFKKNL